MMQIPILSGIYTDDASDFRTAYPRNMVPVPKEHGMSKGYLRPAEGIAQLGSSTGPGVDRGGINWNETCYRVMGPKLCKVLVDGTIEELGDIAGTGQVSMAYSFDYIGIVADEKYYICAKDGTVTRITDEDLGNVIDIVWIDSYFLMTDGEVIIATGAGDPTTILDDRYVSSEYDPDDVKALLVLRKEVYALNRYTIEAFAHIAGIEFPFQRIEGAVIQRGCIGTHACCVFGETLAFLGSGRNEAIAVWMGISGTSTKVSTREVDQILSEYTEAQLADVVFETYVKEGHNQLWIRLPDQTLVYDGAISKELGVHVWFTLGSSLVGASQYLAQNIVHCYGKVIVGHPTQAIVGEFVDTLSSHWGAEIGWDFSTPIIYNGGNGILVHELELVALTGRAAFGDNPTIWTQYSMDGESWSTEKSISAGTWGGRNKRLVWLQQGPLRHWRIQKFRGTSKAHMSVARLEATVEELSV